jgi:ABC-2 type transport system ATP-binding protein
MAGGQQPDRGDDVLRIDSLNKRFGTIQALDRCTFRVERGQMLGLLGPNGAGKTTAMRTVFGLVRPDAGEVTWDGAPIERTIRRRFGYMPEERGLYPKLTVRWQLAYLGRLHGMDGRSAHTAAEKWLDEFGLADRADADLRELSHGNQQRVQLVAALLHDPELVVLDEPFSGLDPIGAAAMAQVLLRLTRAGIAVVFSSHQLDVVEDLCRDVVILHRGRVVLEGRVRELRAGSDVRYLDVVGGRQSWVDSLSRGEVVERDDGHVRVRFTEPVDVAAVAASLAGADVTQLVIEPPPLSEVFRRAVTM